MNDEQKRIAIAEACGVQPWKYRFSYRHEEGWDMTNHYDSFEAAENDRTGFYGGGEYTKPVEKVIVCPDYFSDLNACAEMEKVLTDDQGIMFRQLLAMNSDGRKKTFNTVEAAMCHATARQRCEAFGTVLNLWKDES